MMENEVLYHHLKDARLQLQMIESEIKCSESHKVIDRINQTISKLEALRYAVFQSKPSGTGKA